MTWAPVAAHTHIRVIPRPRSSAAEESAVGWETPKQIPRPARRTGRKLRVGHKAASLGSDFRTPVESIGLPKPEMTTLLVSSLRNQGRVAGTACCAPTKKNQPQTPHP